MTRAEFMEIAEEESALAALYELENERDDVIVCTETLKMFIQEHLEHDEYDLAAELCTTLHEYYSDTGLWRYDSLTPTPVETIDDVEDLLDD